MADVTTGQNPDAVSLYDENGVQLGASGNPLVVAVPGGLQDTAGNDNVITGTVSAADIGSTSVAGQGGQILWTGSPTTGSTVVLSFPIVNGSPESQSNVVILITGTFVGTYVLERSPDGGTTWASFSCFVAGTADPISTGTLPGMLHGNVAGTTGVRVRFTSLTSGSPAVRLNSGIGTGTITVGNPVRLYDGVNKVQAKFTPAGAITVDGTATTQPVSVTASAVAVSGRPDGQFNVSVDPTTLLYDTFETVDQANSWTLSGTVPPTGASGNVSANPGTAANATSVARSQPAFVPGTGAFLRYAALVTLEASVVTGATRWWGLGVPNATPTTTTPVTNGVIFEVGASDGLLYGRVYSGGALTQQIALTRPTDGLVHRYQLLYKSSRVYFNIDNVEVGSLPNPNTTVSALPVSFGTVNGPTALTTATSLIMSLVGVGDTGKNSVQLSDGTYAWRKTRVNADGSLNVVQSSTAQPATYSSAIAALAGAASDIYTISGSATRVVRITRVSISGTQATAGNANLLLVKRTTANTGGTFTAQAAAKHDSNDAAATAVVNAYTAAPATVGTSAGNIRADKLFVSGATGQAANLEYDFGTRSVAKAVVLRGANELLAVNLGTALTGASYSIEIEWTEDLT